MNIKTVFSITISILLALLIQCVPTFIGSPLDEPDFDPKPGTYYEPFELIISAKAKRSDIIFTTDDSIPTLYNGTVYKTPIYIDSITKVKAFVYKDGQTPSELSTALFNLKVSDPSCDPPGGNFSGSVDINIDVTTDNATIIYTINGADPYEPSLGTGYSGTIRIIDIGTYVIRVRAFRDYWLGSELVTQTYIVK